MSEPTPAPLWLRLAAMLYDAFPLIGLWMLTTALVLFAAHGKVDVAHPPLAYRLALRAALLAVTTAYFVLSWTRGGRTIGMRAWRLQLVTADGGPVRWPRALLRFAMAIVSLFALGLGFLWALVDRERRSWHDIAAETAVLRVGK